MPAQGWPDRERFRVSYNSVTRRIRIKPLADTVWNRRGANSHHYIYFKYSDDTQWRWRFRVMVGGVTEGLRLMCKKRTGDSWGVPEDKTIAIEDGDPLKYEIRAEFLPTVPSANQHLLFYLSDSIVLETFYSNDVTKTFAAFRPSVSENTYLNCDSILWSSYGSGNDPVIGNSDDRINELIKDTLIRSDFQPEALFALPSRRAAPWHGIADQDVDAWAAYMNVDAGWIEFSLRVMGNGRSFTLVAIDPVTKMYDCIRITEAPGRAGTQKSIKGDPFCAVENNKYFADEAGGAASFDVYTSYEMDETGENPKIKNTTKGKCWSVWTSELRRERLKNGRQEYPMNKYDIAMYREDLKGERITASSDYVFYMDRDDPLVLERNYNFPVYDMTVTPLNANAISYDGQTDVTINYVQTKENSTGEKQQFGYDGFLKFNSLWNTMNSDDQKKTAHIQYKSIMIDSRTGEYNGDLLWKVTITTDSDDGGADTVTLKIRTIVVAEREKVKKYRNGYED